MGKPLRVLIVEDSADDAELILNELRRGGYEPVSERVETAEAMNTSLAEKQWEIILADYLMPHFTGMNALRLLQSKKIDIPFIIVSGAIGEEVAMAVMKAGAHDYIMKGNMKRLVPAIQRELRETEVRKERRRVEEALRASEEKFRTLLENLPVGVALVTYDGHSLERNKATMDMHGYDSREEFMKVSTNDLYYDVEDRKRFIELAARGPVSDFEVRHKRKDGSSFWVSQSTIPFVTESGETQLIAVSQDITERKKAEEEIQLKAKLLDAATDSIVLRDFTGDMPGPIVYANEAASKARGYSRDEFMTMTLGDFHSAENAKEFESRILQIKGKGSAEVEEIQCCKDGSSIPMDIHSNLITFNNRRYLLSVMRNITERKQAEEELKASEAKFRNLVENAPIGISIVTPGGRAIERNRAIMGMHGYDSKEEFMRLSVNDLYYDVEDRKRFLELTRKGLVRDFEVRHKRKDGSPFWVSLTSIPFVIESGETQLTTVTQDITERKRAEEALRASEEKFRSLLENAPVGITVTIPNGGRLEANKALVKMQGFSSREELLAAPVADIYYDPDDRKKLLTLLEKGPVQNYELRRKRKDGSVFWASLSSIPYIDSSGEKLLISVIQDIDTEKKTEEENELKAMLLDSAGDMIHLIDRAGRIIYANEADYQSHGYSRDEFMKLNMRHLVASEKTKTLPARIEETVQKGEVRFETVHIRKDGSLMPMEVHNHRVKLGDDYGIISIGQDITERKKAEEQMMVTSRLASIGELASGVAHEINNPLTSVIGFSELLLERPLPDDIKEDLTTIRNEAERVSRIVKNLLTFARKHPVSKEPVDVNSIIEKVLELRVYEQTANNIRVVLRLAPDLPKINADSYQLQQVFFNLIVNAEYFMIEAHNKGTLTITTEDVDDAVRISFVDDGPGISEESLQHLFNPFFTTKPVGKGTGLGLSICHGIITDHNGKIYAESTYGKGATFFVEIPFTR